jgi:hypothetical protein
MNNTEYDIALGHIGTDTLNNISHGRAELLDDAILIPVGDGGYYIRITPYYSILYTVQRVFIRGTKMMLKGEWNRVFADELGSCVEHVASFG